MRELYHIHRLLTASESKTQSGDWEIQDSLANTDSGAVLKAPGQPHRALAPEDWWSDESAVEMQQEPSYWATMSKEMNACHDNHQLARILGWLSCRFAFMNAAVQCSISMIDFTMQELDLMKDYSTHSNRHKMKKIMNSACLKHRLEFLNSNLRHMAVFGAIGPRMHTQQTVVSALDVPYLIVNRVSRNSGVKLLSRSRLISCSTSSILAWPETQKKWPKRASVIVRP